MENTVRMREEMFQTEKADNPHVAEYPECAAAYLLDACEIYGLAHVELRSRENDLYASFSPVDCESIRHIPIV